MIVTPYVGWTQNSGSPCASSSRHPHFTGYYCRLFTSDLKRERFWEGNGASYPVYHRMYGKDPQIVYSKSILIHSLQDFGHVAESVKLAARYFHDSVEGEEHKGGDGRISWSPSTVSPCRHQTVRVCKLRHIKATLPSIRPRTSLGGASVNYATYPTKPPNGRPG